MDPETPVNRTVAALLCAGLVVLCAAPLLLQVREDPGELLRWARLPFASQLNERARRAQEEVLSRNAAAARRVRPVQRALLLRALHQGSPNILTSWSGTLLYREDIDLCLEPPADKTIARAVATLRGAARWLDARGVHLIVAMAPVMPVLYPERVWPGYAASAGPARPSGLAPFYAALRDAGVDGLDLVPRLWEQRGAADLFARHNTHWSPAGVDLAAQAIARAVRPRLSGAQISYRTQAARLDVPSDLLTLIDLTEASAGLPPTMAQATQVLPDPADSLPAPQVLLLGDSYSEIYSRQMAGLQHQLKRHLGAPVEGVTLAGATPQSLARALAAQRLQGTKVVIWTFAMRYLSQRHLNDWPEGGEASFR